MRQFLLMTILSIIIMSGCNTNKEINAVKQESIDFDIDTAIEMIKEKEELIIQLSTMETVSSNEYDELEKVFTEEFGEHAQMFLEMFIIVGSETETESGSYLVQETFYPTIFHKGILITDAVINKSYYENEALNETYLTITQEYTGEIIELEDWKREYIFTENDGGEWEIHSFSGEMNFVGEEYSMHYLDFVTSKSNNGNDEVTIQNAKGEILATTSDFAKAGMEYQKQTAQYALALTFKDEDMLEKITKSHIGEETYFYFNGELIASPQINMVISSTDFLITGNIDEETAKRLVDTINNQ